jgi:hypothetical protein
MQTPTPFSPEIINYNFLSASESNYEVVSAVRESKRALLGEVLDISYFASVSIKFEDHERYHASLVKYQSNATSSTFQHPHCPYFHPVYDDARIVAFFVGALPFDRYLVDLLPDGVRGIDAVLRNRDQVFTYRLDGNSVSLFKHVGVKP